MERSEAGRGMKAKSITSCDNAFVTNILLPLRFRAKKHLSLPLRCTALSHRKHLPLPLRFCAKDILPLPLRFRAKDICCPDAPRKAPSRNGNQPDVMVIAKIYKICSKLESVKGYFAHIALNFF
ncbi:hypothetical protein AN161_06680 [Lysinibacillus sp. FJAT-14222]|nr:hypothetical protein AN161_06680 [Lysinibacillus sp. FJAT-14222]